MPAIRERSHRGSASSRSSDTTSRFKPLHRRRVPKSDSGTSIDLSRFYFNSNSSSRAHLNLRNDVVQDFKAEDATIPEFYDPQTIARDILIAADKLPTNEGLNHHLAILRTSFTKVNMWSDLSTFRWDIVDSCEDFSNSDANLPRTPTSVSTNEKVIGLSSSLERALDLSPDERVPLKQCSDHPQRRIQPMIESDTKTTGLGATGKRALFQCKWMECSQLFVKLLDLEIHVRQSHVMGSPTRKCSWINCGKVQPMSTSGLWEHVSETHVKKAIFQKNARKCESNSNLPDVLRCKWERCDESFADVQGLRTHTLHIHVIQGLSGPCDWFNCDCFRPMSALDLWEHVLGTHLPFSATRTGSEK